MEKRNIKVVVDNKLSSRYEKRFVIIDEETGKTLDDAQGYGYKTAQKAHAAWNYKHRDKSKDAEKKAKERKIQTWAKSNKAFLKFMSQIAFEIAKGSWGPDDKFDSKLVKSMLIDNGYNLNELDFTPAELLRYWKNH